MASTFYVTVNDYELAIHVGIFGQGVCFDPEEADYCDPDFINALARAGEMFPYYYSLGFLWNYLDLDDTEHMEVVTSGIQLGYLPKDSLLSIEDHLEDMRSRQVESKKKPSKRAGFVYVLSSDSGLYKIGRTVNYMNRIKTFGVKLPFMVDYEMVIKDDDHVGLEAQLHDRFSEQRIDGEWFALTPSDLDALRVEFHGKLEDINAKAE